jgi:hypothetical protein
MRPLPVEDVGPEMVVWVGLGSLLHPCHPPSVHLMTYAKHPHIDQRGLSTMKVSTITGSALEPVPEHQLREGQAVRGRSSSRADRVYRFVPIGDLVRRAS